MNPRDWDFERWVLALMAVLILVGAGFILWQNSERDTLKSRLASSEGQMRELGRLIDEIFALQEDMNADIIASGKVGPYAYIDQQMVDSRIGKKFNIGTPQEDRNPADHYVDTHFPLAPALPDYDFSRNEIANFLLYIEGNTTRMKVTRIRLELSTRRGAGSDAWKPQFTLTDRAPEIRG